MKSKRVVVVSDLHCGSRVGLTPPAFNPKSEKGSKFYEARADTWDWFSKQIKSLGPIDALIANADLIEGKGVRSGGTELITADRKEQAEMASAVLLSTKARNVFISYGTSYHTGSEEDWEDWVAMEVGARKIGSHDWLDVNGLVFDYRHHIGGSSIPHGRMTAIARERLWNVLWNEHGAFPKADVIIRSHVHYHVFCGGPGWLAMTTPALQWHGSKFGSRQVSGTVDFGFVSFDVTSKEEFSWQSHLLLPNGTHRITPYKLTRT